MLPLGDFAAHTQHAHGIDISTSMLAHAQKSTLQNTAFTRADAQTEPLSKLHYDHLISRFGVMFFEEPVKAFTKLASQPQNYWTPDNGLLGLI